MIDAPSRSPRSPEIILGLLVCLFVLAPWAAAEPALEALPGYFDFRISELFEREDLSVNISIKGPMLDLVAAASRDSDPDLANMLGQLRGIEVQVYSVDDEARKVMSKTLESMADRLRESGWQPALTVRVDRDHGYVFLQIEKDQPVGLAAMYVSADDEAVFVNIVGQLDPIAIGRLASRFNLDLQSVEQP